MLTYDLDRRGKLARYDYLYRCIREDILAGRLTAGEKLPEQALTCKPSANGGHHGAERLCPA